MLSGKELFRIWASPDSLWSAWAAPAFFAQMRCPESFPNAAPPSVLPEAATITFDPHTAIIVDLPGADSVRLATQLARVGYRPVPSINAVPTPAPFFAAMPSSNIVLDMSEIVRELCAATAELAGISLSSDAPPAFFLDSRRLLGSRPLQDDMFDNRWMVFPQDFPSARFLADHGIRQVVLVQAGHPSFQEDLSHVLLRWQEAGISILSKSPLNTQEPLLIQVARPSRFKSLWYRALALFGFRRSSVGGFGSFVPGHSSAG